MVVDVQRQLRRRTMLEGPGLLRASFAALDWRILNPWQAIRQGLDVDHPIQGGNFRRDVLNRVRFLQVHGWD
ncbi:MAG: hypothetical protein ACRBM6_09220 [Geminicoccales bacterium]